MAQVISSEESDGVGLSPGNLLQDVPVLDDAGTLELEVVGDRPGDVGSRHLVVHDAVALPTKDGEVVGNEASRKSVRQELDGKVTSLLRERVVLLVLSVEKGRIG